LQLAFAYRMLIATALAMGVCCLGRRTVIEPANATEMARV
jgi:hypothetical protein